MNYLTTRSNFKQMEYQLRQLRQSTPSLEQATHLLMLTGAYAGLSAESPAVSLESNVSVEQILDKVEDNIKRVQVTLEWFFNSVKEKKSETVEERKAPTEEEKYKHFKEKYSNKKWVSGATLHVKPTILSGSVGGILADNGKVLSVDETIKRLEETVKKAHSFLADAKQTYPKWIKWGSEITEAVTKEWEAHKDEDSIPSITKVVSALYSKQPPRPSKKYKLESYLMLGVPADYSADDFSSNLTVKDVHASFDPLTIDQTVRLGNAALGLYEVSSELFELSESLRDNLDCVGFDDYPYRSDKVQDAIEAFGWKKADWDAHATFDELSFIDLYENGMYKLFDAIHAWLYNAVVERP